MTIDIPTVSAFIGIIVGLGYLFNYLEKTVRDTAREELALWFKRVGNRSFSDALSSCNRSFLHIFDRLYSRGQSTLSRSAWLWLIGMFIVSCTVVPFSGLVGLSSPSLQSVLLLGAVTGSIYAALYLLGVGQQRPALAIEHFLGPVLLLVVFPASLMVFERIFQLPNNAREGLWFFVYVVALVNLIHVTPTATLQFLMWRNKISPFRGILTSLVAMLLIGLFNRNMVASFISDLSLYGWSIFGYVMLNICVDSFSLLETRFVLRVASRGSVLRFAGVVLLDIVASATLFLAIPIASGNLGVFVQAILFKGPRPWIGILFWSSFSTSAFFYLYLLSAGALAALQAFAKGFLRLDRFLPVSERPFRCLGLVAMVITTLIFVVLSCIL